jgi:hypothetical protein
MQSNNDKAFALVCLFDCFVSPVAAVGLAGRVLGRILLLTHFVRAKRVRRRQGSIPELLTLGAGHYLSL